MSSELPDGWRLDSLSSVARNEDRRRVPLSSREREARRGSIPYWGANGVLDQIDDFLFDEPRVLVAEDGTVETSDGKLVVHMATGRYWVNNHAHVLAATAGSDLRWLFYALQGVVAAAYISGSVQPKLSQRNMNRIVLPVPPPDEQRLIASVLGGLDHKLESNSRLARHLDATAGAMAERWLDTHKEYVAVAEVADVVLGGTPSRGNADFWRDGSVPWIASGAVNEFRIVTPTSLITEEALERSAAKRMPSGTPVVAITGATCGKVSRLEIEACANQSVIGVVGGPRAPSNVLLFWLRRSIPELMKHKTGAAQQHVNKANVAALRFPDVTPDAVAEISAQIDPLLQACARQLLEAQTLREVRDELLPKLVRGKIRVPLAEEIAEAGDEAALEEARVA